MLNEKQLQAVKHIQGPALVIAGPGSGKTTVLTKRIAHLIEYGISSSKILVITFTRAAAIEMKSRFNDISNQSTQVSFGTFHSIYYSFIKREGKFRDFKVLGNDNKYKLIRECLSRLKINSITDEAIGDIEQEISHYKCSGVYSKEKPVLSSKDFSNLLYQYELGKNNHRLLDFEDILINAEKLMEDRDIREYWQNRYSYFLVDEFQDINSIQYRVLNMLVKNNPKGENIFAVGDDDQSIYGFRGSSPEIMLDFPNQYRDCKLIILDRNYRCKEDIISVSKNLIEKNNNRFNKEYITEGVQRGKFKVIEFENEFAEADYIVERIRDIMENTNDKAGILFRKNTQAEILSSKLLANKLKYFYNQPTEDFRDSFISKDIASYIRLIIGDYERADIIRIMNKPDRKLFRGGLNNSFVRLEIWRDYYPEISWEYKRIDKLISDVRLLKGFMPYTGITYIINAMGYGRYLQEYADSRKIDYDNYKGILNKLLYLSKDLNGYRELLRELTDYEKNDCNRKPSDERIFLYTFHGSKGLEFDRVFILDAIEDITPAKGAYDIEEERRMFYVAMTRAKSELTLCISKNFNGDKIYPSRFVSECSCDIINQL